MRLSLAVLLTGLLAQTEPQAIQVTDTTGSIQWISPVAAGPVLYVDASATGSNSGSSWCDAYVDLQDALAAAGVSGGTVTDIQVAHGPYAPDRGINQTPGNRGATFQLLEGVAMRGGYAGCGATDPDARDLQLHETILTGDLNGDDGPNFANYGENSYHVVTGSGVDASAVLEGFTIRDGNANSGGTCTSSTDNGGGLYNNGGSPTLRNCIFRENRAGCWGGGICDNGSPNITSCSFLNNWAGGGGCGMATGGGNPTLSQCTFSGNSNAGYGGGLALYGTTGTATLRSCTFTGNLNANSGGAIYCSVGNGPVNLVMVDCTITNNSAMYIGGIMVDHGGHATLTNCLIAGNAATGTGQWGFGGGLGCAGSGVTSVLKNCTIVGNSGTSYGGGISCFGGGSTTLDNCLLWNNTAPNGAQIAIGHRGGAATVSMTYSDSQGGAAAVYQGGGSTLTWGAGNIDGDPKFVNSSEGNYQLSSSSPCIDAGNNAVVPAGVTTDLDGKPRFVDDPGIPDTGSGTPPIVDMGAYEYEPAPPRVVFVDDDAAAGGDGRSWATAYQYLQNALTAAQVDPLVTQIWVAEGTYAPDEGQNQTLGNREATFQLLSGVALRGGFAGNEDPDTFDLANRNFALHETILTGDLNGDDGPNFVNYGENSYQVVTGSATDSTAVLDGFTITGGNANGSIPYDTGGGMYNAAGSPTVTNCVFTANVADRGGGTGNINSANPTFDNCTVRGNKAMGQSSGMYADHSSPTLRGCTFADNQGGAYGALHFQWADSPSVINCVFTGNVSAGRDGGGAISCFYSTLTITGCRITGNSGSYGGGVSISHSSHAQIANCLISGNSATGTPSLRGFGGGVTCYLGATLALDNCTITGNSAAGYGGGVATLMALGAPGTVTMANCILWQNTASFGSQIAIGSGSAYPGASTISVSHSDVQGGQAAAYVDPAGTLTWGLGNIDADPKFANPTAGDYHLLPGSPCIDAGNNAAVPAGITTDLDGNPRFVDDLSAPDTGQGTPPIVDMGAYEAVSTSFALAEGDVIWTKYIGPRIQIVVSSGTTGVQRAVILDNAPGSPHGIALGPNGHVFFTGNSTLFREVDPVLGQIVGASQTETTYGKGIAVTSDLTVYASDNEPGRLYKVDGRTGAMLASYAMPGAEDIEILPDGDLLVAGHSYNCIYRFKPTSGQIDLFIASGEQTPLVALGLAVRGNGNVLVSSYNQNNVLEYDATGHFIRTFIPGGLGGLQGPWDLDLTPEGDLLVASNGGRVLRYSGTSGAFLGQFDSATGRFIEIVRNTGVLFVTGHMPRELTNQSISHVDVTFSRPVKGDTFTVDDVVMTGPGGAIAVAAPQDQGNDVWRISFPEQTADGLYSVLVGPHIAGLDGREMDQDRDGTPGEDPDDTYDATFTIDMTSPSVVIETVAVGNPGNAGDARYPSGGVSSFGSVGYVYNIGKYEVTTGQYCEFLNAVAKTDTYGLYNTLMDYYAATNWWGCNIKRSGSSGSYTYTVGTGSSTDVTNWANRPVNNVSFWDAARFANWLHNGQPTGPQGSGTTERGAYTLDGYNGQDDRTIQRNGDWKWAITSEDEWYKAAYYSGTGSTYYDYPTGTNAVPSNDLTNPDGGNNANFYQNGYVIHAPYGRTPVGEFELSDSPYGTFDQGGNVWEWNEAIVQQGSDYAYRGLRGGSWTSGDVTLHASDRSYRAAPSDEPPNNGGEYTCGFRVVEVLENTGVLFIKGHTPSELTNQPISHVDMTFSMPINSGTFTADDIVMTGPAGAIAVAAPQDQGNNVWRISFPEQTDDGLFSILVGPHIADLSGVEMDQDLNGTPGEDPDDAYEGTFTIDMTAPQIIDCTPSGIVNTPVDHVDVTFSEEIKTDTFTSADILLTGPGGTIMVNAPAHQAGNTWRISFPTQSTVGDYTIAIGPDITDLAGNPLIQPAACGFSIALSDLVTANLVVPPTGDTGSQIAVSWRVANNGTASAATTWQDCVFLSTDNQPGNDTQLACVNRPIPLNPSESYGQTVGVTIPGVVEGNYWIIVKADSANSVFESNEQNNTAAGPIVIRRPNLTVGNVVVPAEACTGEQVAVSWRVTNAGAAPAVGNWQDCLYLSVDDQIGGDTQLLCLARPTNLNAGEGYDRTGTITIPAVPAGNYWIVVKVDNGNTLPETSETDNDAINGPIAIHRPDLVGSNLTAPSSAGTGSQINVSWRVTNGGACPAIGTWRDCVYLSADNQPGNDTQLICLDRPNTLGLAEFYDRTALLTVPGAPDGNYWIIVRVDDAGSVPETDENNNILVSGPIGISRPNLVASNAVVPQEAWTGWTVNVAWRVSNIGAAFALGMWRDCVYLSSDNQLGNDTQLLCLDRPTELIRHDSPNDPYYDRSGGVTIPSMPDGDYWIIIKADDANSLAETDENDNVASGPIHIHVTPKPDLKPQDGSLVIPAEDIVAGSPAGIDWVVTNIGQVPTDAPFWYDRVYLSANQTLDGGDRAIGDFQNPTALNPTEAYAQSGQATIPSDFVGNFYVIVKTDAGNNLTESDENNNVLVSSTQLHVVPRTTPTLTVTNVQVVPSSTWPEASVTVNWKLTNTGNVGTGPFTAKHNIVLSGDNDLNTAGDRTLASQVVEFSGNLAPGTSSGTLTTSVAIPPDVWGDRFVFVSPTIAPGTSINTWPASAPVQIATPVPADLEFTFVNVEPHGISGQPIIMGWTVRNAANARTLTPNWVDVVTMSRDQDLGTTADNITLAVIPHSGALDFDQAYGVNLSPTTMKVFLPDDANGRYYVFVTTDALNQVYEGDPGSPGESNNISSISQIDIEYKAPDLQLISLEVLAGANPVTSVLSATSVAVKFTVKNIVADDGTRVDSWSDQIYLSTDDQFDASDISLASVTHSGVLGPNGTYTVTRDVTIPLAFNSATTHVFVCTDSENRVHESNDANNCAAYGPFSVAAGTADLEAFIFNVPIELQPVAHVFTGATLTAYWQGLNHGPAATSVSSWSDRVYLSTDATLDGNDRVLRGVPRNGGLAAHDEYASQADITIPIDAVGQQMYLFLRVDSQEQNYDPNRNNNIRQLGPFDVWWGPPDLSVPSVSATHGTPRGQVFNVTWTVTNSGGPTVVTEWADKVYLSADRVLSADDVELQGPTGPLAPHTGALAYSESYSRTEPIQVPPNASGYLIVKTDAASPPQVPESNEDNNTNYTALPPLNCDADLVVLSFDAPATALSGQVIKFRWAIRNSAGQATNAASWRDVVYLSRDQWLDRGADVYLGYRDHSGVLGPNGVYETPDVEFRIPYGLTGPYYLFLVADAGNNVCEIDKTNNVRMHMPVQIELPPPVDLVVTSIRPPATGRVGQPAVINWTVKNQGDFEAQGTWTDSVYLSADAMWDINDQKVGERRHNGSVGAGAEYSETLTATLPGVVPGSYYVIVRTDIRNEVRESAVGEQNNITVSAGRIDVQLTDLTLGTPHMGTIRRGESQYFRVVVAADETLRITLDKTAPTGVNRVYVRYGQVPDPGRFDYISVNPFDPDQTITVPTTEAGAYYILVYAATLPTDSAGYVVLAESIPFGIESVTPARIGDNGQVTITLHGARFQQGAEVLLVGTGNVVLNPVKVAVLDGATIKARFVFTEPVPHGPCIVEIRNPDGSTARKAEGVTIELATAIDVRLMRTVNLTPRVGSALLVEGTLINVGNIDVPYAVISLSFNADVEIGWWRPEASIPSQTGNGEVNWLNHSPTVTSYAGAFGDAWFIRDLEASQQTTFTGRVKGFKAGAFQLRLSVLTASADGFLQVLSDSLEMARQYMLRMDPSELGAELAQASSSPDAWVAYWSAWLSLGGLVDDDPLSQHSPQRSPSIQRASVSSVVVCEPQYDDCVQVAAEDWAVCAKGALGLIHPYLITARMAWCTANLYWRLGVCLYLYCDVDENQNCFDGMAECVDQALFGPPVPLGGNTTTCCGTGTAARDPNEKEGPPGYGPQAFVPEKQALPYTVDFENVPTATAWAREVTITDQLSPNLDWRTFQLGEVAFGDEVIQVPQRRPFYAGDVALPDGLICRINAGIDIQTGLVTWTLMAIDPETGEMPESPAVGLLPPNDPETHDGEGHVTFTIKPKPGVATGTEIRNEATIIFDVNEPIETNEVFNTIDGGKPESNVLPLPADTPTADFDVQWSGQDDAGGSGIASYAVHARLEDEPYQEWLRTPETGGTFTGARGGGTYSFYTVAVDNVGNTEDAPDVPDATTLIGPQIPFAPTPGTITAATARLADLGLANVGRVEHAVFEETTGLYVGADGRLTNVPLWQPLDAWAGFAVRALEHSRQYEFAAKAHFAPNEETEFGPAVSVLTKGAGDADGSGRVSQADIAIVQHALGTRYGDSGFDPRADLNGDNAVTFADLGIVRLMATHSGDFDSNDKIDLVDSAAFAACLAGPGGALPAPACSLGDSDLDDDVDLRDFAAFQRAFGLD